MRFLLLFLCLLARHNSALALNVSLHTSVFYSGNQPFVDVGIRILAGGISFTEGSDGKFTTSVGVTMTVLDSTGQMVVAWEKYKLNATDLVAPKDLIDQRRFVLPPGRYQLKILIEDELKENNSFGLERRLDVKPLTRPIFSDLSLITFMEKRASGPFVYNGIYMEPFAFDVVNETQQILHFYTEYYPSPKMAGDTTAQAIFRYTIRKGFEPADTSTQVLVFYKKVKMGDVVPLTAFFDLNKLVSGDYHLEVAHLNAQKQVIASVFASFINRNFPADMAHVRGYNAEVGHSFVGNLDSVQLRYGIQSLASQLSTDETSALTFALSKDASDEVRRYYLFKYWKDRYPAQPEAAYQAYMNVVKAVDNQFYSAFGKGHQTDRGYIFLKYGKPNKVMSVDDEANTPPYEIWYYDFLPKTNQNNVRFIFYSPMLANEYELLHSTCRGERSNKQWEVQLYKNSKNEAVNPGIDATEMNRNWNRKARKLFEEQ